MHAITQAYNASLHMVDFRKQEILIEIVHDKWFVIKHVIIDGWIQFTTNMNANADSAVKHTDTHE